VVTVPNRVDSDMSSMRRLEMQLGSRSSLVDVRYLVSAGYSARDTGLVRRHVEELAELGVPRPGRIPTLYPVSAYLAVTGRIIQVQHPETSGEVEYVLIVSANDDVYVTVGSDHTDRRLERTNVQWSKQCCAKILAPTAWCLDEVRRHWDDLVLRSWVDDEGQWRLYQEGSLAQLLPPEELLRLCRDELGLAGPGLVVFSGTVPLVSQITFTRGFRMELEDPVLKRTIVHEYSVELLPPAVQ